MSKYIVNRFTVDGCHFHDAVVNSYSHVLHWTFFDEAGVPSGYLATNLIYDKQEIRD